MKKKKHPIYCCVVVENRLSNAFFDTILQHRSMLPEHWSCCHINDPSIKTLADYNRLLTSRSFWVQFERFDRVLIFQADSKLLRKGIEEFLEFDFIGAPLYHISFPAMNGGLSLRNPKKMLQIIDKIPYDMAKHGNEDIFFSNYLLEVGGKLPDYETAKKFSVETIFGLGSLGYHAIHKWFTPEQVKQIETQY